MKKNILYLIIAGCCLLTAACNDEDTQYIPPVELQLSTSAVEFKSTGGEGTIEVGNADQQLQVSSNAEWCTINGCNNGVVNFTVDENTGMETRTAVISLTMGESSAKVGITQMGLITSYEQESFFSFGENKGFKQFIRFESELPVTVKIGDEAASWLSYEEVAGGYNIIGTDNTESLERIGKLILESGNMVKEYQFMQFSKDSYNRAWKAGFKSQDGLYAEDEVSIVPEGQEATITFKKKAITFKGTLNQDKLSVACGQYLTRMGAYKIYLGVTFEDGTSSIETTQNFQLLPTMQENGTWALTPQTNSEEGLEIKNVAMLAVEENGKIAGPMDLFTDLTLTPNGEAQEIVKTYKTTFTSATGENYTAINDLIFKNEEYEIGIETKGEKHKFLKSGTYVVNASDGFKIINNNLDYTYFKKVGENQKLDLQSGEMVVNANLETKKYEITMNFILEDGSKVEATYNGEIEGDGFAITDKYEITQVVQLERRLPKNAVDGQFYLKVAVNNWDIEMTLDLRAAPGSKTLPVGTYTLGSDGTAGTLDSKLSDFTCYSTGKYNQKFQSATVKVSQKEKVYTFELDFTDSDGERYAGTISGEVKDMENPQ